MQRPFYLAGLQECLKSGRVVVDMDVPGFDLAARPEPGRIPRHDMEVSQKSGQLSPVTV